MLLRINHNKLHDTIMKVIINSIFEHTHIYDKINYGYETFEEDFKKINIKSENYYELL